MPENNSLQKIAVIYTDFPEKFGIPRQSGLVAGLQGRIVMEPGFRMPEAFLGIEDFSYLWLLWGFSEERREGFKPIIYPPRLGGKTGKGVFATRSPYRPNKIGLSCVKLEKVIMDGEMGPELLVSGVDMLNGTPFMISSRICPIRMPTRRLWVDSGSYTAVIKLKWNLIKDYWKSCRRRRGRRHFRSWHRTPGQLIRKSRAFFTVWHLPGSISGL